MLLNQQQQNKKTYDEDEFEKEYDERTSGAFRGSTSDDELHIAHQLVDKDIETIHFRAYRQSGIHWRLNEI